MFFLAVRQLLSRPRQTILALLGITLGTAAFLTISGIMLGFRQLLINQLINSTAHVRISAEKPPVTEHSMDGDLFPDRLVRWIVPPFAKDESPHLEYPQGWFDRLDAAPEVKAYAPQFVAQVLLARTKLSRPCQLIGVQAARQAQATDILEDMTAGNFMDLDKGGFEVVLGSGLAEKLGIRQGDEVNVTDARGKAHPAKVAGLFQTGVNDVDDSTAYGPLHFVQQVGQAPGEVSQIVVRLKDPDQAQRMAAQWSRLTQEKVQSWDQANASFTNVFKIQDMVRFILIFVILVVASFGIYNILNNMVNQKRGEIAILRSMGYEEGDITHLFLLQGVALGTLGGLLGLVLGTLFCLYLQTIPITGSAAIIKVNHVLVAWRLPNYVFGFGMAFLSGVLSGYFPARSASRMHPIDILRSEG
jgi:lipoprotein-releasing system permease protein